MHKFNKGIERINSHGLYVVNILHRPYSITKFHCPPQGFEPQALLYSSRDANHSAISPISWVPPQNPLGKFCLPDHCATAHPTSRQWLRYFVLALPSSELRESCRQS